MLPDIAPDAALRGISAVSAADLRAYAGAGRRPLDSAGPWVGTGAALAAAGGGAAGFCSCPCAAIIRVGPAGGK
jgi:hypothetical protein